jgi:hypothetical protein
MRPAPLIAIALFFAACAQVGNITGGDKDETPPKLIGADPPHLSTHFTGRRIVLQFDERIQLDRVRDRMLVSPPLDVQPDVRITGARNVTIDLNAPLKPNTTYSFGIGEAVKDLTEGNPAKGLVHVISTGSFVDSLVVAGVVTNAFTGEPEKEVLVMLHAMDDTTTVRTGRPAYAGRSDAEGRFVLRHLRQGSYRPYALRDKNANYRFDLPNEEIAFLDAPVQAMLEDSLLVVHDLRLFAERGKVQQVRGSNVTADGALRLVLAKPAEDLVLRDVARTGGLLSWRTEWNLDRDTVLCWPSDTTELREGRYEVRIDGTVTDSVRYRPVQRMPFHTGLRPQVREEAGGAVVRIRAARPLVSLDTTRITLVQDSIPLSFTATLDPAAPRTLLIRTDIAPGGSASLTMLPKAVRDIYAGSNDTLRTGVGRAAEQSTGTLRIKLAPGEGVQGPFILQLLDMQGRVVREAYPPPEGGTVTWERLGPGNHTLRLIADANANGRWDTGDLDSGLQPEQVWRYEGTLNVRAAWDLGIDWVLK